MNILEKIYDTISVDGTETYFPGQHKGDCTDPYVVVKSSGSMEEIDVSSERPIYDILLYVPKNQYSKIEGFRAETKQKLKRLFPLISYTGSETESYYDESVKGHMISLQYQGIRKIKHW